MTQHLNLYHTGLEPPRQVFTAAQGLAAVAATVLLLSLAGWGVGGATRSARAELVTLQDSAEAGRTALTRAAGEAGLGADAMRELLRLRQIAAGERRLRSAVDTGEAGAGAGFSEELLAFARQAQPQVWLTGLSLSRVDNAIELRGRTTDAALLADYLQTLQVEPSLRGRPFAQMLVRADGVDAAGMPLPFAEFTVRSGPLSEAAPRAPGLPR